jgi:hypothetical protein
MFQVIAETIRLAAHAAVPRDALPRREAPPPAPPAPVWKRQG